MTDGERRIWLDCKAGTFDSLIRILTKDSTHEPYNWVSLRKIADLGERFQFFHIANLIRPHVYSCIDGKSAWDIIVFASQNKFHDLLKLAIVALHRHEWYQRNQDSMPIRFLEQLPRDYAIAFVAAVSRHRDDGFDNTEDRWRKISESFEVRND
jgi:hypothetical protein